MKSKKKPLKRRRPIKYSEKQWRHIIENADNRADDETIEDYLKGYKTVSSQFYKKKKLLYPNGFKKPDKIIDEKPSVDKPSVTTPEKDAVFYGPGYKVILQGLIPTHVISVIQSLQDGNEVRNENN